MATPSIAPVPSRPSAATLARAGLFIVVVLAIATVFVAIVEGAGGGDLDGSPIYLVAVVIVATRLRTAAGIVTAVAAFVIYNLLFTEPRYTLTVADPREWLNLVLFLFVALVIGRLAGIGADRAAEAESRAAESEALYGITRILAADGPDVALPAVARSLVADAGMDRVWCTLEDGGGERTVADTGNGPVGPRAAGRPGAHGRPRRARLGPDARGASGRRPSGAGRGTTDARGRAPAAGGAPLGQRASLQGPARVGRRAGRCPVGDARRRPARAVAWRDPAPRPGRRPGRAGRRSGAAAPAGPRRRGRPPRRGAEERARRLRVPRPAHAARRHSRGSRHARRSRRSSARPRRCARRRP